MFYLVAKQRFDCYILQVLTCSSEIYTLLLASWKQESIPVKPRPFCDPNKMTWLLLAEEYSYINKAKFTLRNVLSFVFHKVLLKPVQIWMEKERLIWLLDDLWYLVLWRSVCVSSQNNFQTFFLHLPHPVSSLFFWWPLAQDLDVCLIYEVRLCCTVNV